MDNARLLEKYLLGMLLNESDENLSDEVMETINDIPAGDARRIALASAISRHQSRIKQQNQITALKNAMISEKSKMDTKKEYKLPELRRQLSSKLEQRMSTASLLRVRNNKAYDKLESGYSSPYRIREITRDTHMVRPGRQITRQADAYKQLTTMSPGTTELGKYLDNFRKQLEICEFVGMGLEEEMKIHLLLAGLNRKVFQRLQEDVRDPFHADRFPDQFEDFVDYVSTYYFKQLDVNQRTC